MTIEQMRQALMHKYGNSIKISKMPDKQIAAMYARHIDVEQKKKRGEK